MIYYVYIYYFQNAPVYVGLGHGNRAWQHLLPSVRKSRQSKYFYNKLEKEGIDKFEIKILKTGLLLSEAILIEQILIKWLGRKDNKTGILYNLTDGGEGHLGYQKSKELKKKISSWSKGKTLSTEHIEALRLANLGKHHSEETKLKLSIINKGQPKLKPKESIPNYIAAAKKRSSNPEYLLKLSKAIKYKWGKKVVQIGENFEKLWNNQYEAADTLKCRPDRIISACKYGNKCKKYKWKFYEH